MLHSSGKAFLNILECLWEFVPIEARITMVRSVTAFGWEDLVLIQHLNSSQRCSEGLRSGLCARHSSSSTPNQSNRVFIELALCSGVQSYCKSECRSSNCYHKVISAQLSTFNVFALLRSWGSAFPKLSSIQSPWVTSHCNDNSLLLHSC